MKKVIAGICALLLLLPLFCACAEDTAPSANETKSDPGGQTSAISGKTPTDGLSGRSDEERLGIRYADIHRYIREGTCGNVETDEKIRKKEQANLHKRRMPVILNPFAEGAEA